METGKTKDIKVLMKFEDGKKKSITVKANATLKDLYNAAQLVHLMEINSMVFKGVTLGEKHMSKTLESLGIGDKNAIQVIARMKGGRE